MNQKTVSLTPTQKKVLGYIAEGKSSKEVAELLFVSKRTIDFHLVEVYDRLRVNNRIAAINAARTLGLLEN